jgi:hypothetical protein
MDLGDVVNDKQDMQKSEVIKEHAAPFVERIIEL